MAANRALLVALVALAVWNGALVALLFTRSSAPAWIRNGLISRQASCCNGSAQRPQLRGGGRHPPPPPSLGLFTCLPPPVPEGCRPPLLSLLLTKPLLACTSSMHLCTRQRGMWQDPLPAVGMCRAWGMPHVLTPSAVRSHTQTAALSLQCERRSLC